MKDSLESMLKKHNKPLPATKYSYNTPKLASGGEGADLVLEGDLSDLLGSMSMPEEKHRSSSTNMSLDFFAPLDLSGLRRSPHLATKNKEFSSIIKVRIQLVKTFALTSILLLQPSLMLNRLILIRKL